MWIRNDFLYKCNVIYDYKGRKYPINPDKVNPAYEAHVVTSTMNTHLPEGYIELNTKGKPQWWIDQYIEGSFESGTGLVFPDFNQCLIEPKDLSDKMCVYADGVDFGLHEQHYQGYIKVQIDVDNGIVYAIDEHWDFGKDVAYFVKIYKNKRKDIPDDLWLFSVGDPKEGAKRDKNTLNSIFDYYAARGYPFTAGDIPVMYRVTKILDYMRSGRLKIFNNCYKLIEELSGYRMNPVSGQPFDKGNHLIDALSFIIGLLPADPETLASDRFLTELNPKLTNFKHNRNLPFALRSDRDSDDYDDNTYALDSNWESEGW